MNCCATVLLRYYGNATGCIGHVTKENPICHNIIQSSMSESSLFFFSVAFPMTISVLISYLSHTMIHSPQNIKFLIAF
jgi:hypothetical protein